MRCHFERVPDVYNPWILAFFKVNFSKKGWHVDLAVIAEPGDGEAFNHEGQCRSQSCAGNVCHGCVEAEADRCLGR